MNCKVNILVEKFDNTIQVPVQVVANRLGRKICYVVTPTGPKEREVVTGAFNDTYVQILDGLKVGEEVLLNPLPFTDSAAASFQQIPPTPEGDALPVEPATQPRRGSGGRGGMRGGGQFDPEQMRQMIEQGGGQFDPEQFQQMMQRGGGGEGE